MDCTQRHTEKKFSVCLKSVHRKLQGIRERAVNCFTNETTLIVCNLSVNLSMVFIFKCHLLKRKYC